MNQHSLLAIELWLHTLGAIKNDSNPCVWSWLTADCSAEIEIMQDELKEKQNKREIGESIKIGKKNARRNKKKHQADKIEYLKNNFAIEFFYCIFGFKIILIQNYNYIYI